MTGGCSGTETQVQVMQCVPQVVLLVYLCPLYLSSFTCVGVRVFAFILASGVVFELWGL